MESQLLTWSSNDKLFKDLLVDGVGYQYRVGFEFLLRGYTVQVPSTHFRSGNIESASQYSDNTDLIVNGKIIEVKTRRNISFTSTDDIPDRFLPFFVTTKSSWDNLKTKPFAVIIISTKTNGIVVVPGKSVPKLPILKKTDRVRNITDFFICAGREHLYSFEEFLNYL